MKTYLFDTINRFKRFSKQLDVKTIICDKAWQVFNDSGEKELYIFNTDGTVLITLNGVVTHGTWQFIAANDSLIITAANQSYMVHPAFLDDCLFALQVDGTDQVAFLIDQKNSQSFAPQTYQQVIDYFAGKEKQEQLLIERKRKQEEEERTRKAEELRRNVEQDRRLREQEENRKREEEWQKKCIELRDNLYPSFLYEKLIPTVYVIISMSIIIFVFLFLNINVEEEYLPLFFNLDYIEGLLVFLLTIAANTILCFTVCYNIYEEKVLNKIHKKNIQKYLEEHPDDPRNAYLKQYIETELK